MTYMICRIYRDERPAEVIKTGLTEQEAQEHCNDPSTAGDDWMDVYTKEEEQ